jgi:hypothetical protein
MIVLHALNACRTKYTPIITPHTTNSAVGLSCDHDVNHRGNGSLLVKIESTMICVVHGKYKPAPMDASDNANPATAPGQCGRINNHARVNNARRAWRAFGFVSVVIVGNFANRRRFCDANLGALPGAGASGHCHHRFEGRDAPCCFGVSRREADFPTARRDTY